MGGSLKSLIPCPFPRQVILFLCSAMFYITCLLCHNIKLRTVGEQNSTVPAMAFARKLHVSLVKEFDTNVDKSAQYMGLGKSPSNKDLARPHSFSSCSGELEIFYLQKQVDRYPEGSEERIAAQRELDETLSHRRHVDQSVEKIVILLAGDNSTSVLTTDMISVNDWDWKCLKSMAKSYQTYCGTLIRYYGMKYDRAFANLCSIGVHPEQVAQASMQICSDTVKPEWRKDVIEFFDISKFLAKLSSPMALNLNTVA